jgi:glutamyl/glutaminyl-tRNA synthetase
LSYQTTVSDVTGRRIYSDAETDAFLKENKNKNTGQKTKSDMKILEDAVRDDLNVVAPRTMGVIDPIKVIIEMTPLTFLPSVGFLPKVSAS